MSASPQFPYPGPINILTYTRIPAPSPSPSVSYTRIPSPIPNPHPLSTPASPAPSPIPIRYQCPHPHPSQSPSLPRPVPQPTNPRRYATPPDAWTGATRATQRPLSRLSKSPSPHAARHKDWKVPECSRGGSCPLRGGGHAQSTYNRRAPLFSAGENPCLKNPTCILAYKTEGLVARGGRD